MNLELLAGELTLRLMMIAIRIAVRVIGSMLGVEFEIYPNFA